MKIAVEGCCHGELDAIYQTLELLEQKNNIKVDLLLICGDFQAVRNMADMDCMAVPQKYKQMNTFYKYYSGEKVAPVLTVFIGGNHEASNYMQELPYGGWVAPKIYYMGYANVIQIAGIRIGGMSGIFKGKDYNRGHFEHPPYSEDSKRSAYHVRNVDVYRLKQVKQPIDIFLSHDWPKGVHKYGDTHRLLKRKKFLQEEIEQDRLGNPAAADLLYLLQPAYWFSAHLHVKFPAVVKHSNPPDVKITKFLSLDKCLPRRQFLQVVDVPHDASKPIKLQLDAEWLAILKLTNHLLNISRNPSYPGSLPGERKDFSPTPKELQNIIDDFGGNLDIPDNFTQTVPVFDPEKSKKQNQMPPPQTQINPQTTLLCSMLDLTDPNAVFLGKDSTLNLPEDADGVDNAAESDGTDDVDEDYESEPSFISLSGSEQSFTDQSFSILSASNESGLSIGQANDSIASLGNADEIKIDDEDDDDDDDGVKQITAVTAGYYHENTSIANESMSPLLSRKRLSLSEKLEKCKSSDDLNDTQEIHDEDENEFAAIIAAQKEHNSSIEQLSPKKSKTDSEAVDGNLSKNSSSSLDCQSLEISDDDPELREMLRAQKDAVNSGESKVIEVSVECEDPELQEIVAAQKKNQKEIDCVPELQRDFDLQKPCVQSSPIVKMEERFHSDDGVGDRGSGKRTEMQKMEVKSPAAKKFKRRNQDLYVNEENEEF
ncbi:lariat debranching enzyme-like [Dreissena polymorpha]|uniref:Lariat debranching enzyme C-terminal domain-containing protein n=1 Tax=Dreissena polymorpha TaxID=45954 RepID=A0A9D4DU25_DREPO|nr:lariat debranching enzyme-like [Dreissena polymorpha]KAH3754117.1 hypothetical protein DPMN_188778 [Dreissena polymorpha]